MKPPMTDLLCHCDAEGEPCEPSVPTLPPLDVPAPYNTFGPLVDYDLSRVDLSSFPSIAPKIDRLDITAFEEDLSAIGMQKLRKALGARVTSSRNIPRAQGLFFMVNDLTGKDLRFLVQHYYTRQIRRLEVAVDFKLAEGENDLRKPWLLKAQLRHCLAPQGFPRLSKAHRKVFTGSEDGNGAGRGCFVPDGLGTSPASSQIIWENQGQGADVVGLYVKTHDRGQPLRGAPFVRLELRLRDSGPQYAGLGRLGLIPACADGIRKTIAPAFHVTSGFKNFAAVRGPGVPGDAWRKWGASWATKHGHELQPDSEVNRRIGLALLDFRKILMRIPVPDALAGEYDEWVSDYS
jgi:hypothetical protein